LTTYWQDYTPNFMEDVGFGIEIECFIPDTTTKRAVLENAGIAPEDIHDRYGNYNKWQLETDCSLNSKRGFLNTEFVSPVLHGQEGLELVRKVIRSIKESGGVVTKRCGIHVHYGFKDFLNPGIDTPIKTSERVKISNNVANMFTEFDQSFMLIVAKHRSEDCHYCTRKKDYCEADGKRAIDNAQKHFESDRYVAAHTSHGWALNLYALTNWSCTRPTVEFRLLENCLDEDKIVTWIWLCQRFLHRALTHSTKKCTRTRKFSELIKFLDCTYSNKNRNEQTAGFVNYLNRMAKKRSSREHPYNVPHCHFANYIRPKKFRTIRSESC